jgi:hypothetical protein
MGLPYTESENAIGKRCRDYPSFRHGLLAPSLGLVLRTVLRTSKFAPGKFVPDKPAGQPVCTARAARRVPGRMARYDKPAGQPVCTARAARRVPGRMARHDKPAGQPICTARAARRVPGRMARHDKPAGQPVCTARAARRVPGRMARHDKSAGLPICTRSARRVPHRMARHDKSAEDCRFAREAPVGCRTGTVRHESRGQGWRGVYVPVTWTPAFLAGVTIWFDFHYEQ